MTEILWNQQLHSSTWVQRYQLVLLPTSIVRYHLTNLGIPRSRGRSIIFESLQPLKYPLVSPDTNILGHWGAVQTPFPPRLSFYVLALTCLILSVPHSVFISIHRHGSRDLGSSEILAFIFRCSWYIFIFVFRKSLSPVLPKMAQQGITPSTARLHGNAQEVLMEADQELSSISVVITI